MKYEFPFTDENVESVLCGNRLEYGHTKAMEYKPFCRFRMETSGKVVGWEDNMVWDIENGALVFYDGMGKKREYFSRLEVNKNGEVCIRGIGSSYLSLYSPVSIGNVIVITEENRMDDILEGFRSIDSVVCIVCGTSNIVAHLGSGSFIVPAYEKFDREDNIWWVLEIVGRLLRDNSIKLEKDYSLIMSDTVVLRDGWREQFESVNGSLCPDFGCLGSLGYGVVACRHDYLKRMEVGNVNDHLAYRYLQDRPPVKSDEEYYYGDEIRESVRFHAMKFDLMK